ncbi:hypothetical protein CO614_04725 [Lysobacteraceae bacterium NML120232]|nr:hypothetical protein CO608_04085 [Xanthomonadaceae bacterium NML08-0793]PJK12578.1 hypothetical protein CO614_04725 [Xanthomonadaceae bacterium NML120232]
MLKRIFATLAALVLLLIALPLVLWGVSKWRGASAEDRAALALMSEPWQPTGRNAFIDFWLADYPVPQAERQAVMDADVRLFEQQGRSYQRASTAAEKWPSESLTEEDRKLFCHWLDEENCLEKVRADVGEFAALIARHEARINRIETASAGDYILSPFPEIDNKPFLDMRLSYLPATRYAVQFVQGDKQAALGAVCRQIANWRRLGANSSGLLGTMLAIEHSGDSYGQLALAMLAELPTDAPLPTTCDEAFAAPIEQEASLCRAMRGEFRFISEAFWPQLEADARKMGEDLSNHPLLDRDMTRADMAVPFAPYCQVDLPQRWLADISGIESKASVTGFRRLSCVANYIGCVLGGVVPPDYDKYSRRLLDRNALLRLMGGVAWLRGQPELLASPENIPAKMPQEYHLGERELTFDAEKQVLVLRSTTGGETWEVPLPASRR